VDPWTAEDAERWWNDNMPGDIASAEAAEQPTLENPDALPTL
jgi:hypothetical protein